MRRTPCLPKKAIIHQQSNSGEKTRKNNSGVGNDLLKFSVDHFIKDFRIALAVMVSQTQDFCNLIYDCRTAQEQHAYMPTIILPQSLVHSRTLSQEVEHQCHPPNLLPTDPPTDDLSRKSSLAVNLRKPPNLSRGPLPLLIDHITLHKPLSTRSLLLIISIEPAFVEESCVFCGKGRGEVGSGRKGCPACLA